MKKRIVLVAGVLFLMLTANVAAKTTIKFLQVISSPERTKVLKLLLDEFEANNTDIKVVLESVTPNKMLEKMVLMAGGDNPPDVMEMPDRWLGLFVGGGLLGNLEDQIAKWPSNKTLEPQMMRAARYIDGTYTLPYGLYLRVMFYNKKLLKQVGIEEPPYTMAEFMAASKAVSKLPEKFGYCFRGGFGGLNAWFMMAAAMNGSNEFFTEDGKSIINEPGSVKGIQFMMDLYQKGYAPKESIDWDFADVVSNFASGKCAFLDQDPDAVSVILKTMDADDFAVTTMPVGPSGRAFPTVGFAGLSISSNSKKPNEAWRLISFLAEPKQNVRWLKEMGILSIHSNLVDGEYSKNGQFSGWATELTDDTYQPMIMPTYLEQFANFEYSVALFSSREALLGLRSAQEIADLWAESLAVEFKKWEKQNEK